MKRILLSVILVLASVNAFAQEVGSLRFYVVPVELNAKGHRVPKYVRSMGLESSQMDYGLDDTFLVACPSITDAQHTTLAANIDVIAIPQNLDAQIGLTALSTVQSKLEGLRIPADWVTTSHTYRDVIRVTGKVFQLMQRFHGMQLRTFFESGITLDTRINQLTQAQRQALVDAATSLGLDTSSVTGPMSLRQALKIIADQLPPFHMEGQAF